ncbi:MAG: glutamate racemase [Candidatus Ryanbacteria bacterium RIFCSPHIGHO2_02_FULL_45_17b]|uniref:Glutamate racemase n=1 Tax=Candidatus Ryanbacteria bacterium RIFCSPHIGHO2_01_FULL_45_22 TaxID=1802114 RepID=A0A1G2FYN5_9BACT|nr:MAG: glutamate racemase [Candidatus Ryanbacteria bacterium RIFCSPHIGHO2_01_FULL_45_22]OGZ46829.1 MAG: glutamate racemase [Candidatus Ryanbacteria bacterium RIFCSPHIGHO2_02_FULL_45_17b]
MVEKRNQRIGVFDSGLGGLFTLRALARDLPMYDYVYVGDTKRVPYGNRSPKTVYEFTRQAVEYLFLQKKCKLVIVACNTASALALRRLQREFLPNHFPDRRLLGVLVPLAEAIQERGSRRVGVLATQSTTESHAIQREIVKRIARVAVFERAAPLLVPIIESGELQLARDALAFYLKPLIQKNTDCLALGCTHYPIFKRTIKSMVGPDVAVVSQDEFLGAKLADYLKRHPDVEQSLSRGRRRIICLTDKTPEFEKRAKEWFGKSMPLKFISF